MDHRECTAIILEVECDKWEEITSIEATTCHKIKVWVVITWAEIIIVRCKVDLVRFVKIARTVMVVELPTTRTNNEVEMGMDREG